VTPEEFAGWFDSDGRLVRERTMRQRVFEAGIHVSCRRRLWKFLFEIYPPSSTFREQKTIDIENRSQYQALCRRWEVLDEAVTLPDDDLCAAPPYMELSDGEDDSNCCTPASESRQRTVSDCSVRCHSNGGVRTRLKSPSVGETQQSARCSDLASLRSKGHGEVESVAMITDKRNVTPDQECVVNGGMEGECDRQPQCGCDFRRRSWDEVLDEEGEGLLSILELTSKVFAARQPLELETSYSKAKRIILRDVLRTDRNFHYFSHKRNLRKVHRILLVYAMFHPDMGYAQGMNDLLARFLVVTDSEVDSYWMFVHYMTDKRIDFMESTMMRKVALVKKLISEIDEDLFQFFEASECHDYLFCHRWLLLDFKREFEFQDSLRIFEVLGTHYLELYSDKAQVETDKAIAMEFLNDGGEVRHGRGMMNFEFTFDLFVSAAILTIHRDKICLESDAASLYGCMNSLSMNMDLSSVLDEAVRLCLKYCRQSVTKGFAEIDI
jgi:hypothetical protein